jgi:hypothetical protein
MTYNPPSFIYNPKNWLLLYINRNIYKP